MQQVTRFLLKCFKLSLLILDLPFFIIAKDCFECRQFVGQKKEITLIAVVVLKVLLMSLISQWLEVSVGARQLFS